MKTENILIIGLVIIMLFFFITVVTKTALDNSRDIKIECIKNNQTYINMGLRDMGYPLSIEYCGKLDIEELKSSLQELKTK